MIRGMRRRALVLLALAAAIAVGIGVWRLESNAATAKPLPVVTAGRSDVVVTVGGVGRIVELTASGQVALPTTVGGGAAGSARGGGTPAPANAVFPHVTGFVSRLLVVPGQRVAVGQPLAVLDDGGTTAAAVRQAQDDITVAQLELTRLLGPPRPADVSTAQLDVKRAAADFETLRGGSRAARAKAIGIARRNVQLAQKRLARTLAPPSPADLSAVQAEVKKAQADLAALRKPPPTPLREVLDAARQAVIAAQQKLAKLTGPPDPIAVSTAQLEVKKAQADLAALQKPPPSPLPELLEAARQAVIVAQQKLAKLTGPPDPIAVSTAQLEVKKAEADLDFLQRRPEPAVTLTEFEAAKAALENARVKYAKVLGPPDPADVSALELELDRARAELATLQRRAAPSPEATAAARQALDAARLKLAKLRANLIPADVSSAVELELDRARAELATLQRRAAPSPEATAAARQAIDAARLKLAKLRANLIPADVSSARLDLERARAELRALRAGPTQAARVAAQQAVDSARAKLAQVLGPPLQADIALAQEKVNAARGRFVNALVARRLLTVRAPWRGTVTSLLTTPAAPVDAATPIATVADLDRLAVNVDLSEFDVARVRRGLRAVVSVDALGGKSFPGKVVFAALTGNDTGGVVTFPVLLELTHPRGLKPGMNVSARIIVAKRRGVVQVPLEAVTQDGGEATVMVVGKSGTPVARAVTMGLANNKNVEIVAGLRAGERVVVEGTSGGAAAE